MFSHIQIINVRVEILFLHMRAHKEVEFRQVNNNWRERQRERETGTAKRNGHVKSLLCRSLHFKICDTNYKIHNLIKGWYQFSTGNNNEMAFSFPFFTWTYATLFLIVEIRLHLLCATPKQTKWKEREGKNWILTDRCFLSNCVRINFKICTMRKLFVLHDQNAEINGHQQGSMAKIIINWKREPGTFL